MGFTNGEGLLKPAIILMLSTITSVLAFSTVSSYPKDFKRHASPHVDWEPGLKEAARQVLLRNRDLSQSIKDKLLKAPIAGKENRALPFGDIAILARGQLFAVPEGFRWVQDPYQNDCIDCHATRFCKHSECGIYEPHGSEKLLALWSVRRIRHRTGDLGLRYELEYTISPINPHNKNTFVDKYGGFNYNIPGHVFIVKTQNEVVKTHNNDHFVSNYQNWNNHKYIPAGLPPPPVDEYYLPIPSTVGNIIQPLRPSSNKYLPAQHGSRPDYHYLPQKPTQSYHHTTPGIKGSKRPTHGSKNDLYKKLLESLAQKTSTKFMLVPTKAIPHRFGPPTKTKKPTTHTSSSPSSTTNHIPVTFTTHAHIPTTFIIPSTLAHVPTTAQQIPTPQIPTSFIPMRPQTMTTIYVPTKFTTTKQTTPFLTTSKLTTASGVPTTPYVTSSKLTSPYTTSKLTTGGTVPYIPTTSYYTTKETLPYPLITTKQTIPYTTSKISLPYTTSKVLEFTNKINKETTPYCTTIETPPILTSKITTPYYTSKQTIPYITTPYATDKISTTKETTPYISTTKDGTSYISTLDSKDTSQYYTTNVAYSTSPYYTTKETSPYYTTKETSPYYTTKETSPYYTTKETSPQYTTKETDSFYTSKDTSPYYTTKDTSTYYTTKETSPYDSTSPKTTSVVFSTVRETTTATPEHTLYTTTESTKPIPTFFIDPTHPGYPRTTPYTPFTESYDRGKNLTGPATTSHSTIRTTTTKTSPGMTTLQLPSSTDRYFPESTPHVIKIPPKPPVPNTPFKKPGVQDTADDYSDEYELFPEDKNKTTTTTSKTTSTTGKPKPTEGFLLHEDEYFPNKINDEEVDKAIATFDKEFTQKPVVAETAKPPVINKEFDDVFEQGTTMKQSDEEEDTDLFPEEPNVTKLTTAAPANMVNYNNQNSDIFPDKTNSENVDNVVPNKTENDSENDEDLFPLKVTNDSEPNPDIPPPMMSNKSEDNRKLFTPNVSEDDEKLFPKKTSNGSKKFMKENDVKLFKTTTKPTKVTTTQIQTEPSKDSEENVDLFPVEDSSKNTHSEKSEDYDTSVFNAKLTTERLQIAPTASVEKISDSKIIYSGFFEPSTTPMTTTDTPTPKLKQKKHVPTQATNRIDEISTKQSLSTSVSYKVNKYKRRRAPTRIPEVHTATTTKNKFEVKYSPRHAESRTNDGGLDLIQIESNNTKASNKLVKYRRKLYARTRKPKTRAEN